MTESTATAGKPRSRFFTGHDVDPAALDGHRVAVVGYGALGRSMALNLRDSGADVTVGNIADGYRDQAAADGFIPVSPGDAAERADEVLVLLPDEVIGEYFGLQIAPRLRAGTAVCFASGYALAHGLVTPPPAVDVLLLAPRMSGAMVRELYQSGEGFFSCVSAETDATGKAWPRLLALAAAAGGLGPGAIELPASQEAVLDLLIEQTFGVYLGIGMQLAFATGTRAGLPPEALVLELYMSGEMSRTISAFATDGFFGSLGAHGLTALYGGFIRTGEVDGAGMQRMFDQVLDDIRSGRFAARLQREQADGYPTVKAIRELIDGDNPMSAAERRVRAALGNGRPQGKQSGEQAGEQAGGRR